MVTYVASVGLWALAVPVVVVWLLWLFGIGKP